MEKEFDIVGIGNPLLDIIVEAEEEILADLGLKKGEMHLVDGIRGGQILETLTNL